MATLEMHEIKPRIPQPTLILTYHERSEILAILRREIITEQPWIA